MCVSKPVRATFVTTSWSVSIGARACKHSERLMNLPLSRAAECIPWPTRSPALHDLLSGVFSWSIRGKRVLEPSLFRGEQGSIPASGGSVDRHHLLGREAAQIIRAAGLWPRAGQADAAERLRADHGTDHVAVDVDIAVA